jgi:hypothetical protein
MKKQKKETSMNLLFQYLNRKYGVSMAEVEKAIDQLGLVRGHLDTFFMVEAYQKKKQQQRNTPDFSGRS